jgi:sugar O-acyltransferase (sialic acid O-acetyltransferase NeuD family)
MTKPLLILGTGGTAQQILDVVEAINSVRPTWTVAGFLDDARPVGSSHLGFEVVGRLQDARRFQGHFFVNAIGSDKSYRQRPKIVASTGLAPEDFATLVHPTASVSSRASLGRGVVVHYLVLIDGGVSVGDHVSLSAGCMVGHDTIIEDYVLVAPGATVLGFVHLGRGCYIGARAVIRQHLRVGEQALVGMGAVVLRDVAAASTVVGNPARPIKPSQPLEPLPFRVKEEGGGNESS